MILRKLPSQGNRRVDAVWLGLAVSGPGSGAVQGVVGGARQPNISEFLPRTPRLIPSKNRLIFPGTWDRRDTNVDARPGGEITRYR